MRPSQPSSDSGRYPATIGEGLRIIRSLKGGEVHLPGHRVWSDDELASVLALADAADARQIALVVRDPHADLCMQLDMLRLHRRLRIEGRDLRALDTFRTGEPEDLEALNAVIGFREDPDHVLATLRKGPLDASRALFEWIVHSEDSLYAMNLVRPYQDLVPTVLKRLEPRRAALLLEGLSPGYAARVLCDDYTRVAPEYLGRIVSTLSLDFSAKVIRSMLRGADRPRRLAAVIRCSDLRISKRLLNQLEAKDLLRLIDAAESRRDAEWVVAHVSSEAARAALLESEAVEDIDAVQRRRLAFESIRSAESKDVDPRQPGWHRFVGLETFRTGMGRRVVEKIEGGRWIHIDELLNGPFGPKRVVADILELDSKAVRLECVSAPRDKRLSIAECQKLMPLNSRPDEAAFRKASLFRLRERSEEAGALAAINGNFFFDYGHYENAPKLGIDCSQFPGLRFGDPVGWYVERGHEFTPPVLNRCALVVTEDGKAWIERTKMTRLRVGEDLIEWGAENEVPRDCTALYTPLWGQRTPRRPGYVDYSIQGNEVQGVFEDGDVLIPLTGFVLSVPKDDTRVHRLLECGEEIQVENNFPRERGRVVEAMACGPQLVRGGSVEIDFAREEFGTKDSTVMSFFLPRLVDRYEAARSFVALTRSGSLLLGTVSGRAFGLGGADQPAGVTFGELAQLARDLGAHEAMGLDGGGSSSLIARDGGELTLLNAPTGGADVVRGKERFIANALLVHRRD